MTATATASAQTLTPSPTTPSTPSPTPISTPSSKPSANSTEDLNVATILNSQDLADTRFWLVLLAILVAGGMGGLVFELLNLQGNIEIPHKPTDDDLAAKFAYATAQDVWDLGVVARLIIGALAAPPVVAVVEPTTALVLLATSAVAGSAGTLIFRSLQDRLLATVLQASTTDTQTKNTTPQDEVLDKAIKAVNKLDEELRSKSKSEKGLTDLEFTKKAILDPSLFSKVNILLNHAKSLNAKVDGAINAYQQLEQEVKKHAQSPEGTSKMEIPKGTRLNSQQLDSLKQHLIEAKSVPETTTPATTTTTIQATAEITTPATTTTAASPTLTIGSRE